MKEKNENFIHAGRITKFSLTGRIKPENSPAEGTLTVKLKANEGDELELTCFIYLTEPDNLHTGKLRIGDDIKIRFVLLNSTDNIVSGDSKLKRMLPKAKSQTGGMLAGIDYVVEGEILRIEPHPDKEMAVHEKRIVLDCGIYITTGISVNSNLKVGDYVRTSGRLDGFVLEKVK